MNINYQNNCNGKPVQPAFGKLKKTTGGVEPLSSLQGNKGRERDDTDKTSLK